MSSLLGESPMLVSELYLDETCNAVAVPQVCRLTWFDVPFTNQRIPGCVVAGRLAYADPNLKVMLIEGQLSQIALLIKLMSACIQVEPTIGMIHGFTGRW